MSYWHCTKCHHEWEGIKDDEECDWCGNPGYILEETTPLEMFIGELRKKGLAAFSGIAEDKSKGVGHDNKDTCS